MRKENWRSLAAATVGQVVEIREIQGEGLRAFCHEIGLNEGDVLRCRVNGTTHKIMVTTSGRTIVIEQDFARFICVGDSQ